VVTAKMALRYRQPVRVGSHLLVYGRLVQEREKIAVAEGWLTTTAGTRVAEATGTFFKIPQE
jgi:acyl-coenzyme A thioesterase PaaI-like protein